MAVCTQPMATLSRALHEDQPLTMHKGVTTPVKGRVPDAVIMLEPSHQRDVSGPLPGLDPGSGRR